MLFCLLENAFFLKLLFCNNSCDTWGYFVLIIKNMKEMKNFNVFKKLNNSNLCSLTLVLKYFYLSACSQYVQ